MNISNDSSISDNLQLYNTNSKHVATSYPQLGFGIKKHTDRNSCPTVCYEPERVSEVFLVL